MWIEFHGILNFPIVVTIIFNFAWWIHLRKLIGTLYLFMSLSPTYFFLSIFALYHFTVLLITHYVSPFKISFQCSLKLILNKTFHGISTEFHGTFWTTFEQHMWFHGIPWNFNNKTPSSVEFHGILSRSKVSCYFIELFPCSRVQWNSVVVHGTSYFPDESSIEFHGTW